jgi:hypothetical protein
MAGRVRDPLVGRDLLAGLLAGVLFVAFLMVRFQFLGRHAPEILLAPALESLRSVRHFMATLAFHVTDEVEFALGGLFFLLLLRLIVRNTWVAAALWVPLVALLNTGAPLSIGASSSVGDLFYGWDLVFAVAMGLFVLAILLRLGLLATLAMMIFVRLLTRAPITLDLGAWYIGWAIVILLIVMALSTYGFVVALAGRPAFGGHWTSIVES